MNINDEIMNTAAEVIDLVEDAIVKLHPELAKLQDEEHGTMLFDDSYYELEEAVIHQINRVVGKLLCDAGIGDQYDEDEGE